MSGRVLPFIGSREPWAGGPVTASANCVLAPNASPWTLDGTNTWLLGIPGGSGVVIDPGPADPEHLRAVVGRAEELDLRLRKVLLTHGHVDHSEGARALAGRLGVDVRALDPAHRLGDEGLVAGDVIDLDGPTVEVVCTPGHSADSVCFVHDRTVLTGDTVLGRGTSLVAWPDGRLSEYLDSLRRLRDVVEAAGVGRLLPGHGPVLDDPAAVIDAYLDHRLARLAEVREVIDSGVHDPSGIVEIVYRDVPREVWPAAELTVRAQLEYLRPG